MLEKFGIDAPVVRYFSIVRNPVDRVISEYNWWKGKDRKCSDAWPVELCDVSENATEWILSPFNSAHNRQAKSLMEISEMYPIKNLTDFCKKNTVSPENCGNCRNLFGAKDYYDVTVNFNSFSALNEDPEVFQRLKSHIEVNFAFLGVLDDYEKTLELSKSILQFRVDAHIPRKTHESKPNYAFTDAEKLLIKSKNKLDFKLYEYALKKLYL